MSLLVLLNRGDDLVDHDNGALTAMIGGRRGELEQAYMTGGVSARSTQQFNVLRDTFVAGSVQWFNVLGDIGLTVGQSYNVSGAISVVCEQDYVVLDGTMGVFDEGGLVQPLLGWRDPGVDFD